MPEKLTPFDAGDYLQTQEDICFFINEALATQDSAYIAHALQVVAKTSDMTELARKSGIEAEILEKTFAGDMELTLATTVGILGALGLRLSATVQNN
ncbi:MAG: putative addiction module antidote protein [Sutterellaceae bacterium]|nr:putative addiction module antidote protein [Sutterellaceae bacterium]